MNLLQETLQALTWNGKTPSDVEWVGTREYIGTWQEFVEVADITYDSGYGSTEINEKLVIVGKDWWLERSEYDGSEWWSFKKLPAKPEVSNKITRSSLLEYEGDNDYVDI